MYIHYLERVQENQMKDFLEYVVRGSTIGRHKRAQAPIKLQYFGSYRDGVYEWRWFDASAQRSPTFSQLNMTL